jgi:hypothetical protein
MNNFLARTITTFIAVLAVGGLLTILSGRAWFISPYLSDNTLLVGAIISLGSLLIVPVSSMGAARASIVSPSTARYSRITQRVRKDSYTLLLSAILGSLLAFAASVVLELLGIAA